MRALVLAEHESGVLKDSTDKTVAAAALLGGEVDVLVAGSGIDAVAGEAASLSGVAKVLYADDPCYEYPLAESLASLIVPLMGGYDALAAPATTTGKNILPRVAALLDVMQISDIVKVEASDIFVRPIYAGNALQTVRSRDAKKVITVRITGFKPAPRTGKAEIVRIEPGPASEISSFLSADLAKSERPELTSAKIIVSGGRALGSAENFKLLERLADRLHAAVGASRAAVDAGYVPNDYQVGQTGKVVAPDLYIAVGISGAIQHLAGMKESKVIVAINKDADAPIFQIADYGLIGDLFKIIPELEAELAKAGY